MSDLPPIPDPIETKAQQATVKTVEHGEASTLPKAGGWGSPFARHAFVFLLTAVCMWIVWVIVGKLTDVPALREIARNALGVVALLTFGLVFGAGASDVIALLTAFWSTKKITVAQAPKTAAITATPTADGMTRTSVVTTPPSDPDVTDPTTADDGALPPGERIG